MDQSIQQDPQPTVSETSGVTSQSLPRARRTLKMVPYSGSGSLLPENGSERGSGVLVGLHRDSSTRCIVCRLVRKSDAGWPGVGRRVDKPGSCAGNYQLRRVSDRSG
jgi:hypothetical protein